MNYGGRKFTKIKQTQLNFKYLIRKNLFVLWLFYDFKQKQYNTSVTMLQYGKFEIQQERVFKTNSNKNVILEILM